MEGRPASPGHTVVGRGHLPERVCSDRCRASPEEGRFRLRLRWPSMASHFEVMLDCDRDERELQAILEDSRELVDRLEVQLSAYIPASDVCLINRHAHEEPVRVEPGLFGLLEEARRLHDETEGAFDITIGPLARCWGFHARQGAVPSAEALASALARVGMDNVHLDSATRTVRFARPGMEINLGAIGKGYVVDRVVARLRQWGIRTALVEAGGSSVYGLGCPPVSEDGWLVGVRPAGYAGERLGAVALRDEALGVSGDFEQSFVSGGVRYGHVLDPRTGWPASGLRAACVVSSSASRADALATALNVMAAEAARQFCERNDVSGILVSEEEDGVVSARAVGCKMREVRSQGAGASPETPGV